MMNHGAVLGEVDFPMAHKSFLQAIQSGSTHDVAAYLRAGLNPNHIYGNNRYVGTIIVIKGIIFMIFGI